MRTDRPRKAAPLRAAGIAACAALALAAACSRSGAGDATGTAARCDIPQWLAAPHRDGYCGLPADLRRFVSEHQEFKAFSGGEPSDAAGVEVLAREHDARVREQRAAWSRLRDRYAADSAVSGWMQRYGRDEDSL
ncbi:hypothetical protein J5226_19885 [Lysobacter sp. K5869]|uniref:hypothetical protein n=1 Tax=Lysobacter sp. K5869 TaxID=2820808 RepID=UPI001C0625D4|nr:hypothetical protein [Lysobacter sp. K5869]QWP75845.1 hypothetical protein J5226_19885 [Lysobacter sp. K5869]